MSLEPHNSIEVFYSYAHEDEALRDELKKHLSNLKRRGVITDWYDRDISAGEEWNEEISRHLNLAKVILLLVSPDFMDSDYINDVELKRAMERHKSGEARVIPVILRPVDWEGASFSKLQSLPSEVRPVTSWEDPDEAFLDITKGIRKAIQQLCGPMTSIPNIPNIPRPPAVGFVARRDIDGRNIVERLREELAPERNQLVVLHGPGGVGKTTLAAETARSLSEVFGGRIAWISADGRQAFALSTLLDDAATQLGREDLRQLGPEQKAGAVAALLASETTLVVLDNFETIAAAEQARCVEFLSQHATFPALITTRQKISSARNITIPAMDSAEADEFLKLLIAEASDRSAFAQVDLERVKQVSIRNPLVMQWVIAQIDLAQEAGTVLDELKHGGGDAAQHVFDRSFELEYLGDDGRAVLLALSLFVPDASRASLAEVSGFGADLKRLNEAVKRLASLSLVKTTAGGSRLIIEGLTRELAKTRLSKNEDANEFRRRLVVHFLSYAEGHAQLTAEDFDAIEAEKDNAFSSMDLAFDLGDWESVTRVMAVLSFDGVNGFLRMRGYWEETIRHGTRTLQAARNLSNEALVAGFTYHLAITYQDRGELEDARRLYTESLEIAKKLGNQSGIASTLHQLAMLAQEQGELVEARRLYHESREIAKKLGNQSGISITSHQLAMLAHDKGELEEARRLYHESLEIERKLGNQSGIAASLHELGRLAQAHGELKEAHRLYRESLEIKKKLGNQSGIAGTLHQLATLAQAQGELDEARRLYHESLEIKKKLGNQSGIAASLHELGRLAQAHRELKEAHRLYHESLEIEKKLGNQRGIASTLHQLATLAQAQGELEEAHRLYYQSLEIKRKLGNQSGIAITLGQLGRLSEDQSNLDEAARLYRETLAIFEKLGSPNANIARQDLARVEGKSS